MNRACIYNKKRNRLEFQTKDKEKVDKKTMAAVKKILSAITAAAIILTLTAC